MGFVGLALGAMLHRDGIARADEPTGWTPPDGRPHHTPRAKRVIWLMMRGGVSHLESFDPKPASNKHAGKTIGESPYKSRSSTRPTSRTSASRSRTTSSTSRRPGSIPLQIGFRQGGESGIAGQRLVAAPARLRRRHRRRSARCTRPTTTTARSWSSSPAAICSTAAIRRSAPGSTTAWGR